MLTFMLWTTMTLAAAANADLPRAGAQQSGAQQIEPAFTGTIVSVYPDGRVSKLWLDRDGGFSSEGRTHEHKGGRWTIRNGKVCLTQSKPVPIPFLSYCAPIPAAGMASGWTGKAVTGEPITSRLMPGR